MSAKIEMSAKIVMSAKIDTVVPPLVYTCTCSYNIFKKSSTCRTDGKNKLMYV